MKIFLCCLTLCLIGFATPSSTHWGKSYRWGNLDTELLDEESGMVASRIFPGRLYHHNDSGDEALFYLTDLNGKHTNQVQVDGWNPQDVEDIALSNYHNKNAFFLADIGDNNENRDFVKFAVIEELESYQKSVKPLLIFEARYPDGPHNAEACMIDRAGNLYVITKNEEKPAKIYRINKEDIERSQRNLVFRYWGKIDVPKILNWNKAKVTSATLSLDNHTLLLLTKRDIVEAKVNLENGFSLLETEVIKLHPLFQQESITFLPGENSFLYSTESDGDTAEIWRVDRNENRTR